MMLVERSRDFATSDQSFLSFPFGKVGFVVSDGSMLYETCENQNEKQDKNDDGTAATPLVEACRTYSEHHLLHGFSA